MNTTCELRTAAKRQRKMAREPKIDTPQVAPHRVTKSDLIVTMLSRTGGATLDELIAVTGWLSHTTRAALTGLNKKGRIVTSDKLDGVRRYRIEG